MGENETRISDKIDEVTMFHDDDDEEEEEEKEAEDDEINRKKITINP